MLNEDLLQKWQPIIEHPDLDKIQDVHKRNRLLREMRCVQRQEMQKIKRPLSASFFARFSTRLRQVNGWRTSQQVDEMASTTRCAIVQASSN